MGVAQETAISGIDLTERTRGNGFLVDFLPLLVVDGGDGLGENPRMAALEGLFALRVQGKGDHGASIRQGADPNCGVRTAAACTAFAASCAHRSCACGKLCLRQLCPQLAVITFAQSKQGMTCAKAWGTIRMLFRKA